MTGSPGAGDLAALSRLRSALDWRHPRYRSVLRMDGGRTILALVGLLLVLMGILWMIGRIDTVRRSGTATVAIISSLFQPGGGIEGTLQGTHLRYTYVVDGTTYLGADFRRWSDVEAHHPKVCFEPANPANHILVDGRVRCGIDPGP